MFDTFGKVMDVLINKVQSPGNYKIKFNASKLENGVYYYKLTAGDFIQTKKMLHLK